MPMPSEDELEKKNSNQSIPERLAGRKREKTSTIKSASNAVIVIRMCRVVTKSIASNAAENWRCGCEKHSRSSYIVKCRDRDNVVAACFVSVESERRQVRCRDDQGFVSVVEISLGWQ